MKKIYSLLIFAFFLHLGVFAQSGLGTLRGKVIDGKTKKPLDYVSITLKLNGVAKATALSDDDGAFIIKALQPGEYDLFATFVGYPNTKIEGIYIAAEEDKFVDFSMSGGGDNQLNEVVIKQKKDLVDRGGVKGGKLTAKEIMASPVRNVNSIANTVMGVESRGGGTPNIRGARAEGTAYYIDGVRVNAGAGNIPQNAIDQIQVITGGTPAQYGDFVGGAISITTKAPTKFFNRGIEVITASPFAGYLDNSHFNQTQALISGPIKIINKGRGNEERVLVGFLLSGAFTYTRDGSLPAVDLYQVKADKLAQLEKTPLVPSASGTLFNAAEYLRANDLEKVGFKQNAASYRVDINGNFNFQPTKNINVRLGYFGNFAQGNNWSHFNSLMNSANNSMSRSNIFRTYLQFTQSFSSENDDKSKDKPDPAKVGGISNAFYSVRLSYERAQNESMDPEFQKDFFSYGYLGKFTTYQAPTFSRVVKNFGQPADSFLMDNGKYIYLTNYVRQVGNTDTSFTFEQANINRVRGNYTQALYDYLGAGNISNLGTVRQFGGLINGDNPNGIYSNMWGNVGTNGNGYSKSLAEIITVYIMSEFTIAPKSNPKAKHEIQLGITGEQQFRRSYGLGTNNLWSLMRLYANRQFTGLDSIPTMKFDQNGVFQDTVWFNRKIVDADQTNFDKNLRNKLMASGALDANGNPINQYSFLDVNSYTPGTYSLDMFNADELLNNGNSIVSYSGYDHLGRIVRKKPSIEDFLNNPTSRLLPAYQPTYLAAWVQDKFVFKDLIVRVGLRMERFDANQPVLKDPYSMAPIYSVGEVKGSEDPRFKNLKSAIPTTIGDDYAIYVNNEKFGEGGQSGDLRVAGFRKGNNWYDENGNPISDPAQIGRNAKTARNTPLLIDPSNPNKPTLASFTDYVPDVKLLPRVWFSFPISTSSQFFGTYDILTQRPSANVGQIDDYYFLQNRLSGGAIANPDLKMTQVTDYEIGFRQQIGQDAALGIIASYREYRNMVQLFRYVQAWPNDYTTFGNLDFSTVKSIGLEYTIREIGNVSLGANYQIQFADGTGSNATSSNALIQVGLPTLRTIYPMDFDTRHTLKMTFDFHYKSGKEYNGPVVNGKKILENAGINFVFTTYSGRPYTQNMLPTPDGVQSGVVVRSPIKGTINGANLPAQYNIDINIDKNFEFKQKKLDGSTTVYRLRAFIWIQNLLNSANVTSVFRYTGSAYNDGFLASPQAQEQIRTATDQQSYVDLYNARMLNPDRFGLPRLTRLGLALYF
jgi:hypothetical protein